MALESRMAEHLTLSMTLGDLMEMDRHELYQVMVDGHPLDLDALADSQYLGVDLSLPALGQKLLWQTFRKTFHRCEDGTLRGWNVRMEQHGVDGPAIPMMKRGKPLTFGHYRPQSAEGIAWPAGYQCAHFLDYGNAGNPFMDLARLGYTPLVAVNEGSMELLLGWEIFKLGPALLPMPLYWALRRQGTLDYIAPVPG